MVRDAGGVVVLMGLRARDIMIGMVQHYYIRPLKAAVWVTVAKALQMLGVWL